MRQREFGKFRRGLQKAGDPGLWTGTFLHGEDEQKAGRLRRSSTQSLVLGFPEMWKEPMPRC